MAGFLRNLLAGGPDAGEAFLRDWFGPPAAIAGRGDSASAADVPAPLRDLYALVERWPGAVVQNHLLSPPPIDESRLVFYVENQGVYEWAVELGTDVISGRRSDARQWIEEEPTLESFSLELLVFEAIMGARHGAQRPTTPRPSTPPTKASLRAQRPIARRTILSP